MLLTRTPLRVSFVGGGSDLKSFYSQFGGAVLSTSINKYIFISSHPSNDEADFILKHGEMEKVKSPGQLEHPIVREVLSELKITNGMEITSTSDVPPGTGMGSSSSFTVGLFHNLLARKNLFPSRRELAEKASRMEIDVLKEPIGKQDQYAAAVGGLNIIRFNKDDSVEVIPVKLEDEVLRTLEGNLLLFYTARQRRASSILSQQKANMSSISKQEILKEMVSYVSEMAESLEAGKLDLFGKFLHKNWVLKRRLAAGVSSEDINLLYETALKAGASGGKLLGAGGGGFLLFYCEKERQGNLRRTLKELKEMPFSFDYEGTKILYSDESR